MGSAPHTLGMHPQDIITKLLQRDPKDRLGTVHGAEDIKAHPFFADIQWALIRHRTPPYVPAKSSSAAKVNTAFDTF